MRLIIMPDPASAMRLAAGKIAAVMTSHDAPVLGLATGRTMEGVYSDMVRLHQKQGLDFSRTITFNLDEYAGIRADNHQSYHYYMHNHLFQHVNIMPQSTHLPDGVAPDAAAECAFYEQAIRDAGGIDLQLLGIGMTGHIGFNEPPSPFDTRTRCVTLSEQTRRQNAVMFGGDPEKVPTQALTMGVGTILEAKRLLLLALGSSKAAIIAKMLEGDITPQISASAIRLHQHCTIILDEASAAHLDAKTRDMADFQPSHIKES